MGQKVNPHGLRVGIVKDWDAKWYADKDFAANLHEDVKIRNFLKETLFIAGISRIEIERTNKRIKLTIHTAKQVWLSVVVVLVSKISKKQ